MKLTTTFTDHRWIAHRALLAFGAVLVLAWLAEPGVLLGQDAGDNDQLESELDEELGNTPDETTDDSDQGGTGTTTTAAPPKINLLKLLVDGSWPMIPIVAMLVLVATFVIERILGLRRIKVLPEDLTAEFGRLATQPGGFDPRKAYRVCQKYPCAAARVIRAMLLKIGRPHAEVEHAVMEANEREAARLYANVRWLNLAAAVTPLMGLFGTVWGMINAFYATANLPQGHSKAEVLADGIVLALVTTLGGLFVAIPAAITAHFFEGRIQTLFREIDELLFSLLPQVERYEGKLLVSRELYEGDKVEAPPVASLATGPEPPQPKKEEDTPRKRPRKEEKEPQVAGNAPK